MRCRLCSSNDRDSLVEHLAEEMWESRRDSVIDPTWVSAGDYWHRTMRQFAAATLNMLEHEG